MPFIIGNAANTSEFYTRLKRFVLGRGHLGQVSYAGAGNGALHSFECLDLDNADEVYTVVCETTAAQGGGFDVISSLRGNLFDTQVNQVYQDSRVQFYLDFSTIDFAPGDTFTLKFVDYVGTKARFSKIEPWTEARTETITLTCTVAGQAEVGGVSSWVPAEFSVVGSVSGAMGSYAQGTPFASDVIRFTLGEGDKGSSGAQYQVGDVLRIYTTRNALRQANQHWETLREYTDANGNDTEWLFKGRGLSGDDEIFVGILRGTMSLVGMRGYSPGMILNEQPGVLSSGRRPIIPTYSSASGIGYWVSVDGRSIRGKLRNNTYYHDFYLGLGIPWGSPRHQPYFLCVGGGGSSALDTSVNNSNYWNAMTSASSGSYRDDAPMQCMDRRGVWRGFTSAESGNTTTARSDEDTLWPMLQNGISNVAKNLDGSRALLPICLLPTYGELDKVYCTNTLARGSLPEDILWNPATGKKYVISHDAFRTTYFQAMELS